jgi:hypothetical protein
VGHWGQACNSAILRFIRADSVHWPDPRIAELQAYPEAISANPKFVIGPQQAPSESDLLQKAISSVAAIAPKVEGRITRVDAVKDESACPE